MEINIYCDESCHLPNDKSPIMVLGALKCPKERVKEVTDKIYEIKAKHKIYKYAEIKWVKVSPAKFDFYKELIDLFVSTEYLYFRAVIADKTHLNHERYEQTHDEWYYKMYYLTLNKFIVSSSTYNIFIDIKDTEGNYKVEKVRKCLSNSRYDFNYQTIKQIQLVPSYKSSLLQLADLIIGAVSYRNRNLKGSQTKLNLIKHIESGRAWTLNMKTPLSENKLNTFIWNPSELGK